MLPLIGFTLAAFALSYVGTRVARHIAHRHQILDVPNERSSHTESVPRGGGAPIVALTLAGLWIWAGTKPENNYRALAAYTVGGLIIAAISWLDDWRSQPNWLRFSVHTLGAVLAIYAFGAFPFAEILRLDGRVFVWLGPALTAFWIIGLTNAYNFMDGIDGIAGGQAVIAGLAWAAIGWVSGHSLILTVGMLVASTSLGFLIQNWPPARIFMGDVGSAFLGYTFAVLPLMFNSRLGATGGFAPLAAGILAVWLFVFDSTFTILRRLRRGENVFNAHRSHLYQRLVIAGNTHQSVSLLYCGLAILGAVLAVGWTVQLPNIALITAILLPLLWLALWIFVIRQEQKQAQRLEAPQGTFVDPDSRFVAK
jgi:UDP-N-acetylmuramyl pentapeptide phosphotransferase/UDP-N-acetylglucosamine-1-phosphate transferase